MFDGNDLPDELLLKTRQRAKLRNAFNNNMSTDLKLSKAQISKIIQSGGFLGSLLSKLSGLLIKIRMLQKSMQEFKRKYTWFWDNNFNNFEQRNEGHNENCSSS